MVQLQSAETAHFQTNFPITRWSVNGWWWKRDKTFLEYLIWSESFPLSCFEFLDSDGSKKQLLYIFRMKRFLRRIFVFWKFFENGLTLVVKFFMVSPIHRSNYFFQTETSLRKTKSNKHRLLGLQQATAFFFSRSSWDSLSKEAFVTFFTKGKVREIFILAAAINRCCYSLRRRKTELLALLRIFLFSKSIHVVWWTTFGIAWTSLCNKMLCSKLNSVHVQLITSKPPVWFRFDPKC